MNATFAERLAHLRAQKGLTQRELGAAAGVAWSMISKYEAGKSMPRLKVLMRLGEALGVSVEELQGAESGRPSVELYEGFSSRLLELRCRKKISLRLLSKRTGIETSVLTEFELGDLSPSTDDLYNLADALGVSVSELAGQKDEAETVRIKLSFEESPDEPVTFAVTPESYQSLIEAAEKFKLTPGEVLARLIESAAGAASDPGNASEGALNLLDSMKLQ
ncbi:helix-turn-helix domain-containing protein [Pseudomonas sp. B21-036]|jgi:transcriptional regulator with XRE-family HTH domain|uniref:helix-turn-helix domain-containing protein n=1 Tax=Pseudomonas TaxID=286 RepID=UPI001AE39D28|nr:MULTISPECIES: helix-turn-helix transcriptional regulator [Pseudomonas]UVL48903.1 helix-turn-helix domain-containing protein [Pseudomonas sp. B21-036]